MIQNLHLHDNTLFYRVVGEGPVVLFLHGFLGDSSVWCSTIDRLKVKFRCISIDLPDHGKSELHSPQYTMESIANSVLSILEKEDVDKFHIIGHSMGGYVGLEMAKIAAIKVQSLTLLNSTMYADTEEKKIERDRAVRVFDLSPKVYIKAAILNLIYAANHSHLSLEIDELVQIALNVRVKGAKAALIAMRDREEGLNFIKESKLPLHMISGKYDSVCPINKSVEQLQGLDVKHTVLENCGHMAFVEEPKLMVKAILEFLNEVS